MAGPDLGESPLFPSDYEALTKSFRWRDLHRARTQTPRWREVSFRLDRSLRMLRAADGTADGADDWPEALAPTLAQLAGPIASIGRNASWDTLPESRAWARSVATELLRGTRMAQLAAWAHGFEARLDDWFEIAAAHSLSAGADAVLERRRQATGRRLWRRTPPPPAASEAERAAALCPPLARAPPSTRECAQPLARATARDRCRSRSSRC